MSNDGVIRASKLRVVGGNSQMPAGSLRPKDDDPYGGDDADADWSRPWRVPHPATETAGGYRIVMSEVALAVGPIDECELVVSVAAPHRFDTTQPTFLRAIQPVAIAALTLLADARPGEEKEASYVLSPEMADSLYVPPGYHVEVMSVIAAVPAVVLVVTCELGDEDELDPDDTGNGDEDHDDRAAG